MAVERVREGETPSAAVASYGFSRMTIYKWLAAVWKPGVGVPSVRSRRGRQPDGHAVSQRVRKRRSFVGSMVMILVSMAWISAYGREGWWLTWLSANSASGLVNVVKLHA
jgi:hypothetical protein